MATKDEVNKFLSAFNAKSKIFDVIFMSRDKNLQTLLFLEITPSSRKEIIKSLTFEDYSEGPITDILNKGADMWIFGKTVKNSEVYIKITMGTPNNSTICISFHLSEYKMDYPLKKKSL